MKVILISAAYSDMAKETISLLKEKYYFVLTGRDEAKLNSIITELDISDRLLFVCKCDNANEEDCAKLSSLLEKNDIVLSGVANFAGGIPIKNNIESLTNDELESELKTRVIGNVNLIRYVQKFLSENGSIVMINGALSKIPDPDFLCGSVSTSALRALAKSLSKHFSSRRIRVNTINPCACNTKMKDILFGSLSDEIGMSSSDIEEAVASKIPFGRLCEAKDVANGVKFLLSDESSFITGISLDIDGGYNISLS